MSIIYDMASGRTQLASEKNKNTAAYDELIPAPAVQEPFYGGLNGQSRALSIHLINALLKKDRTS